MKKAVLFFVSLLLTCTSAQADDKGYMSNKEMLDYCEQPKMSIGSGFCVGYIRGTFQQKNVSEQLLLAVTKSIIDMAGSKADGAEAVKKSVSKVYGCIENRSGEQLEAVFVKWAKANPERWHEPAFIGILQSGTEAFPPPCD